MARDGEKPRDRLLREVGTNAYTAVSSWVRGLRAAIQTHDGVFDPKFDRSKAERAIPAPTCSEDPCVSSARAAMALGQDRRASGAASGTDRSMERARSLR